METLGQEQQVPQHSHSTLSLAHSRRSLSPSRVALSRSLAHSRPTALTAHSRLARSLAQHSPNTLARSLSPNTLVLASVNSESRQFRTRNRTLPLHLGFGPPPPCLFFTALGPSSISRPVVRSRKV
ncbi:hypothetical protein Syun_014267 [Stephania yunnanensis]|uniref:Uncharacterized protein n=1 Tax=Stephania yunnanensis TaxID=152371 RepID=A0AAP0JJ74_9MAGN